MEQNDREMKTVSGDCGSAFVIVLNTRRFTGCKVARYALCAAGDAIYLHGPAVRSRRACRNASLHAPDRAVALPGFAVDLLDGVF